MSVLLHKAALWGESGFDKFVAPKNEDTFSGKKPENIVNPEVWEKRRK